MVRCTLLALVATTVVQATSATDYQPLIDYYLNRTLAVADLNKDGAISCSTPKGGTEFSLVQTEYGIQDLVTTTDCIAADTDKDGKVTILEFGVYASNVPTAKLLKLVEALTGVSVDLTGMGSMMTTNPAIAAADAAVETSMTSSTPLSEMSPSMRSQIVTALEKAFGLAPGANNLFVKFTAGSTKITAKAFFPDAAAADAASASVTSALGSTSDASTALGVPVTSAAVVEVKGVAGAGSISYGTVGGVVAAFFILLIMAIVIAMMTGSKKRSALSASHEGCCSTGCCSEYALKGWSCNVLLGVLFLLIGAIVLFLEMSTTKSTFVCLIDKLFELADSSQSVNEIQNVISGLPIGFIRPFRSYVSLLDLAVILPAIILCLFLFLASMCACRTSGTMCCAKFFTIISYIVLVVCLVFYIIFIGLGIATQISFVRDQLKVITSICDVTVADFEQRIAFATTTKATMQLTGTSTADIDAVLNSYGPVVTILSSACSCADDLIVSLSGLFIPGTLCTLGVLYLFIASISLCCSAKCCKAPGLSGKTSPQA